MPTACSGEAIPDQRVRQAAPPARKPYILGLTLTPTPAKGMLDRMAPPPDPSQSLAVGALLVTLGSPAVVAPVLSPPEAVRATLFVQDATSPRGPSASHYGTHPLHITGSRAVAVTSGAGIDFVSAAPSGSGTNIYFYVAVPVTEVGTYVSDQIVDDIKFAAKLKPTWVPPTVRHHQRR